MLPGELSSPAMAEFRFAACPWPSELIAGERDEPLEPAMTRSVAAEALFFAFGPKASPYAVPPSIMFDGPLRGDTRLGASARKVGMLGQ